jgi:hypothetical protein
VRSRATFRAPHWPLFAFTAALAPVVFLTVCAWLDDAVGLTATSAAGSALVVVQLLLLGTAGAWVVARFLYLTLYRLELDRAAIRGRSVLKTWNIELSDIEAVVPGWRTSWWRADHNRYVVKLRNRGDLFIWCGKGLIDFLRCVAETDPRLAPSSEDDRNRVERGVGRSGFAGVAIPKT